ncbi:MAG: toprim domain-containing protein [Bacteroidota bacterium]
MLIRSLPEPTPRPELLDILWPFLSAFQGSPAEEYMNRRGIPTELAERYAIGYAGPGDWPGRPWSEGRIVFPHFMPGSEIVNLYGRAIELHEKAPKQLRHDHLSGPKGWFNCGATSGAYHGQVFICEGPFDALSLIAAGHTRSLAIFGLEGLRWSWLRDVQEIVFAFDSDMAGREKVSEVCRAGAFRGKTVRFLDAEDLGKHKDVNEAWIAGDLCIRE